MASVDPKERPEAASRAGDECLLSEHADSDASAGIEQPEDILDKLPQDRQREFLQTFTKVIIALGGFGAGWGASRFRR